MVAACAGVRAVEKRVQIYLQCKVPTLRTHGLDSLWLPSMLHATEDLHALCKGGRNGHTIAEHLLWCLHMQLSCRCTNFRHSICAHGVIEDPSLKYSIHATYTASYPSFLKSLTSSSQGECYAVPASIALKNTSKNMSKEKFMLRPLMLKVSRSPTCQPSLQPDNLDSRLCEPPGTSTPQPKRAQVRVACVACQKLKAKASEMLGTFFPRILWLTIEQCDSHRPSCARCTRRSVVCRYDVEPDISRFISIQRRNEAL